MGKAIHFRARLLLKVTSSCTSILHNIFVLKKSWKYNLKCRKPHWIVQNIKTPLLYWANNPTIQEWQLEKMSYILNYI